MIFRQMQIKGREEQDEQGLGKIAMQLLYDDFDNDDLMIVGVLMMIYWK